MGNTIKANFKMEGEIEGGGTLCALSPNRLGRYQGFYSILMGQKKSPPLPRGQLTVTCLDVRDNISRIYDRFQ
jgi:hypothetical protein